METQPIVEITVNMINDKNGLANSLNQNFTILSERSNYLVAKIDGIEGDIKEIKTEVKSMNSKLDLILAKLK